MKELCQLFSRVLILSAPFCCCAASLADFTKCISAQGQGSVCQLDAGMYTMSSPLLIGRSNVTIIGASASSPGSTVLQRAVGYTGALLHDSFAGTLQSITIRDMTFDGNRQLQTLPYTSFNQGELAISSTRSALITNVRFLNAPHIGLTLYGGGAQGIVVSKSYFGNAALFGLWSGTVGTVTDQTYLGCSSSPSVDNLVISGLQFDQNLENAIYISNIAKVQILANTFTNNYSIFGPFGPVGGAQVDIAQCADDVAFVSNTIAGNATNSGTMPPQGMELHGTNLSIVNNTIRNNSSDGINIGGGANIFIANWDQRTAITGNHGAGIAMHQSYCACGDSIRPVDGITIDRANVVSNGLNAVWGNDSVVPLNHLSITNGCFSGNGASPAISLSNLGPDIDIQNNSTSGCGSSDGKTRFYQDPIRRDPGVAVVFQ